MSIFFNTITPREAKNLSAITLAFVGDAVQSLYVRTNLALDCDRKPVDMQRLSSEKVSAIGQNALLERVLPHLTSEEEAIYKRGRNTKKSTKAKNASAVEYSRSTGFEAIIGYLYLIGNYDRIEELLNL